VAQTKKSAKRVYSLWTSPQSSWNLILDGVDLSRRRAKSAKPTADRDLEKRRKAFEAPVDHEGLIRYVY
jgi:hypothetical protein